MPHLSSVPVFAAPVDDVDRERCVRHAEEGAHEEEGDVGIVETNTPVQRIVMLEVGRVIQAGAAQAEEDKGEEQ